MIPKRVVLVRAVAFSGERDVVDRGPADKVAGDVFPNLAVVERLEGFEIPVAAEDQDRGRRRRGDRRLGQDHADGGAKLFEASGDAPEVALADVANQ